MLLGDDDPLEFIDSVEQSAEERLETAKQRINEIADSIRDSCKSLFIPESGKGSKDPASQPRSPELQRQQLEQLCKVCSSCKGNAVCGVKG